MADGGLSMNKDADLENVTRESAAPTLPFCLFWMIPLAGFLFAVACGTPPQVTAGELLLLDNQGQPVAVGEPLWEKALYYHEDDNATPYTGPIEATYTNGGKRMLAFVRNGQLDGSSVVWFEDSNQEQWNIKYESGSISGFKKYDENGALLAEYPEPSSTNVVTTNTPPIPPGTSDVKLSMLEFGGQFSLRDKEGFLVEFSGTAIEQWPNGKLKKRETFNEGEHNGSVEWWHENGKQWYSATYIDGLPEGRVEAWRPDGTREYVYTWEDGFPSSKFTYASDGTKSGTGVENDVGTLIYFHPNGNKKLEEVYEGNILAPSKQIWYDENGKQIDPPPKPPEVSSPGN